MSKLAALVNKVPLKYENPAFREILQAVFSQCDSLSEGRMSGRYQAQVSVPTGTAVAYGVGDIVWDSNTTVRAGVSESYVRLGWVNTVAGTPGTFKEMRVLVSNLSVTSLTASLGSDVALNNTANFFDGPSVSQGTTGTWFVSGNVLCKAGAIANTFVLKLWDGTTVIDNAYIDYLLGGKSSSVHLSGVITSPAGDLRISVKDTIGTDGAIVYSAGSETKHSTITAFRIA